MGINYGDGCDVHPNCLECPLAECKHDDPQGYHRWRLKQRDDSLLAAFETGLTKEAVADQFAISVRQTDRIIVRCKAPNGVGGKTRGGKPIPLGH